MFFKILLGSRLHAEIRCRNLLEFERKYSPAVPTGAACAKNFQKSNFLKQKNINFSRPGGV